MSTPDHSSPIMYQDEEKTGGPANLKSDIITSNNNIPTTIIDPTNTKTNTNIGTRNSKENDHSTSKESTEGKKTEKDFRNYEDSERQSKVAAFYRDQHTYQCYDYVVSMEKKYFSLNHFQLSIWECLEFLDSLIDDSDPDTNNSQLQHALQTAEAIRAKHPDRDWMILTGLIHDLGKILSIACKEPQWAVVGDSFPVGCAFSPSCIFSQYFQDNPDIHHPIYSTDYGLYEPHCGLSHIKMSFGHDEYLYRVCLGNDCTLPKQALAMIRFHSFYPWHDKGAYKHLMNSEDEEMLLWVKEFNSYDLYSKDAVKVDVPIVKPYYLALIQKYFPDKLNW